VWRTHDMTLQIPRPKNQGKCLVHQAGGQRMRSKRNRRMKKDDGKKDGEADPPCKKKQNTR